jgi:hypothetical protein
MRGVHWIAAFSLVCTLGIGASACDSSDSTGGRDSKSAFLSAVARDTRIAKVDYDAIRSDELVAAGEAICDKLARKDGTPDGLDLEQAQNAIVTRYALDRAMPKNGAEQDPRVPLRNADLRLAGAIGVAAVDHLCPDQAFNPAR